MGEVIVPSEPIGEEGRQKNYSRVFQRALTSSQIVLSFGE
jgi:hypothetical protein